jgi:23S rRNA A1618 N6-methylase RlmF
VRGLDIGCGANLVYSLLGASAYGWHMTALDTDGSALAVADRILTANTQLQNLICLLQGCRATSMSGSTAIQTSAGPTQDVSIQIAEQPDTVCLMKCTDSARKQDAPHDAAPTSIEYHTSIPHKSACVHWTGICTPCSHSFERGTQASRVAGGGGRPEGSSLNDRRQLVASDSTAGTLARPQILKEELIGLQPFDFCVCNPPFFEHVEQACQNPDTAHGGTSAEMACEGGEAAFVSHLIQESTQQPNLCRWFSSMLGKKTTFRSVRMQLHSLAGVTAVRSTELKQGKTYRWAVAWSFVVDRNLATVPLHPRALRCFLDATLLPAKPKKRQRKFLECRDKGMHGGDHCEARNV